MKFIVDTDPGTDDAVAILIALAHFSDEEFLAITTVAGNVNVEVGTVNALRILEHANRKHLHDPNYKKELSVAQLNAMFYSPCEYEWLHCIQCDDPWQQLLSLAILQVSQIPQLHLESRSGLA